MTVGLTHSDPFEWDPSFYSTEVNGKQCGKMLTRKDKEVSPILKCFTKTHIRLYFDFLIDCVP